jgi:hypothetical protein
MKWSEVEQRQPRLADLGRQRLLDPGVVLVATIRRDGTPVTSRDGRDGEFKVRGTARSETDADVQSRYAAAVAQALGWNPEVGRFHLFDVSIGHLSYLRYDDSSGDQYVTQWPPGREYVRRGTTPTSLGEPEQRADVLVPD